MKEEKMNTNKSNTGFGSFHPSDAGQYAEITITVKNGITEKAEFRTNDETVKKCAQALCELITGFPTADILQINNNAVYYNIDEKLPLENLFCATIAVTAAKKAAIDYLKKNSIPFPSDNICSCIE